MANYVLVYYGGSAGETDADRQAQIQAWGAWFGSLGDALADSGNPFSGQVKTIASNGSVSEGGVGTPASGYSIIKADSLDQAIEKAKGSPLLASCGQIAVYETFAI